LPTTPKTRYTRLALFQRLNDLPWQCVRAFLFGNKQALSVMRENTMNMSSQSDDGPVVLSEEDKRRLAIRARRGLFGILFWQILVSVVVALLFWLASGLQAGVSALVGAGCYLVPNAVLVLRLALSTFRPNGAGPKALLIGHAIKVLAALVLLWLVADAAADRIDWLAMIVGLIAALKGYWVGLLITGGRLGKKL